MARIRTIKPEFFKHEGIAELPAMTRLFFIGMWLHADIEGKLEDRPKRLKIEIFPYDNYDVEKGLTELQNAGFISRYKGNANVNGRILSPEQPTTEVAVIKIANFNKHQKIDKVNEKPSQLPDYQHKSTESNVKDYKKTFDSHVISGERKGREGEREAEREREKTFSETDVSVKKLGVSKKKETTQHWTALVQTWFDFYKKTKGIEPIFKGAEPKALKSLAESLQESVKNNGKDWSEQTAVSALTMVLTYCNKNNFFSSVFELHVIAPKINSIIDGIRNDRNNAPKGYSKPSVDYSGHVDQLERELQ